MKRIYLDYAAATPVDKRVVEAMLPYFSEKFYNPSALYEGAKEARRSMEEARSSVARIIGAKPSEIIFTAGGTESANLAVNGVMSAFPDSHMIASSIEHDAVLKTAKSHDCDLLSVDSSGIVRTDKLKSLIRENTVLISVILANNEIGSLQPLKEITSIVAEIRNKRKQSGNKLPIYVHTDACQAPLYLDIHVKRLVVDLMTLNGGKIHGPKQSGILFMRAGTIVNSVISGGGQEWGYRSGTENVAFAVGFARALGLTDRGRSERVKKTTQLRDYFMNQLVEKYGAEILGHKSRRIANNVCAAFPGCDNERVLFALDDLGVDAATGSACSASSDESSHVLLAMGKTEAEARSSIRFSLGKESSEQQIDEVIVKLKTALSS